MPDMTVGSVPWTAKTVCDYYCGEGKRGEMLADGAHLMLYRCARCGERKLVLRLHEGTVRCDGQGCISRDLDSLGLVAELEGLDLRSQRRAVHDKRNKIIRDARDGHAASLVEFREQQAIEAELGPRESRYTPEQRRAALEEIERREAMEEKKRRREERERWRREDEARREAALAQVTDARAAVTWRELLIALPLCLGLLLAVYYGSVALQDYADYRPAPEGLEGLGIPGEGGEPDSRLVSIVRSVVGWLLPDWLVPHRFAAALLCALVLGGGWWLYKLLTRRRAASIEEDEYVGVYSRDDDGTIVWR